MSTLYRIILSATLAAIAAASIEFISNPDSNAIINPVSFVIIFIATALGAFISPSIKPSVSTPSSKSSGKSSGRKGREIGTVKWFNVSKGYGFVTRASGEEIFVHFRSISGNGRKVLREGQKIEFSVVDGDKGPQAEDVDIVVDK
ncbi:Cold-shock DNA-binding protein [marine gamma proteobacterium HTCC2143]|jgi:CspA family cold shock protein|uniref:Cold-shock DNA-binding protein n=1 Tax=marine gamma proteobacterium HTCC2143 TaxID=247633 RepID=A0YCJ0_9GAMM|nr:Cold-shock DNA-binding protein [marine gamma proteobacterium HTCC2143]